MLIDGWCALCARANIALMPACDKVLALKYAQMCLQLLAQSLIFLSIGIIDFQWLCTVGSFWHPAFPHFHIVG